jgi:hypothetical protein
VRLGALSIIGSIPKRQLDGNAHVFDTRTRSRFTGEDKRGRTRGGHLPGAQHLSHTDLLDNGDVRPAPALCAMLGRPAERLAWLAGEAFTRLAATRVASRSAAVTVKWNAARASNSMPSSGRNIFLKATGPLFACRPAARVLPAQRVYATWEGGPAAGGLGAFPFQLTVPGGRVPTAGVTVPGVLPTHRRRGVLRGNDASPVRCLL